VYIQNSLLLLQVIGKEVKKAGVKGEVVAFAGDVRKEEDIQNAIKFTIEKFGKFDVLVSNAGVASFGNITCAFFALSDMSTKDMHNGIDTNLIGSCIFAREAVQSMKARGIDDGHLFFINRFSITYSAKSLDSD
jgi:NAD(P)-dependent dehydrogenase (short-subunit alcohol dehydrogenase family)